MATKSSRDQMIDSAIALMQRNGAAAVTVDAVLANSGAPRGSVYYHFPGGRDQIRVEAVTRAGEIMTSMVQAGTQLSPGDAVEAMRDYWVTRLVATEFTEGCPITGAAVGGAELDEELRTAAAEVFHAWHEALVGSYTSHGVTPPRAQSLATMVVAGFEGVLVLARMRRSVAPLVEAAAELRFLVESALAAGNL